MKYFITKEKDKNGDFVLHSEKCTLNIPKDKLNLLGDFPLEVIALIEAQKKYAYVYGCKLCCTDSNI